MVDVPFRKTIFHYQQHLVEGVAYHETQPALRQQDLCEDQFGLGRKLQISIGSLDCEERDLNWNWRIYAQQIPPFRLF